MIPYDCISKLPVLPLLCDPVGDAVGAFDLFGDRVGVEVRPECGVGGVEIGGDELCPCVGLAVGEEDPFAGADVGGKLSVGALVGPLSLSSSNNRSSKKAKSNNVGIVPVTSDNFMMNVVSMARKNNDSICWVRYLCTNLFLLHHEQCSGKQWNFVDAVRWSLRSKVDVIQQFLVGLGCFVFVSRFVGFSGDSVLF